MFLIDVSGVSTYQVVSGDAQTGVVDTELPFPFVVRATNLDGEAAEGTPRPAVTSVMRAQLLTDYVRTLQDP